MSAKREKQRRRQLKREYEYDLRMWLMRKPPRILFWQYRKWKKSRPVFDKRAEPIYFWPRTYTSSRWY